MKSFQTIILGIFIAGAIGGVIAFATFSGGDRGPSYVGVTMWGTLPQEDINITINEYNVNAPKDRKLDVTYRELRDVEFDQALIEALAEGAGPDLVLLPHELIGVHKNKALSIPFVSFPERDFKSRFIESGEAFLLPTGVLGVPVAVDPLVLYWNRTHFTNAGIPLPPSTWDEMHTITQRITTKDEVGNITRSAVALGEFANINNAKDILTTLIMQSGDPITVRNAAGETDVVFGGRFGGIDTPAESALRFFTEFSNPAKSLYSWNRSLPEAREAFLAGDLAMYFGYASEIFALQAENPNLNFDVAPLPQIVDTDRRLGFGRVFGLVAMKASPNSPSAFHASSIMSSPEFVALLGAQTGLPSARRDMLSQAQVEDAFKEVFRNAAIIATNFSDPDPAETYDIFERMTEDVTSGRETITVAVAQAVGSLRLLVE